MALSISQTHALRMVVKPGMRVASLGYPDIISVVTDAPLEYRADSEAICKRHGLSYRPIPDADSYFAWLGCKLTVYDIVKERGSEIICDLNYPLPPTLKAWNYDIVLDVGTAEHCFNIGQALINMAGMVKMGGYIIHENPFASGNHGFYNLNPTLFADFYTANGFEVLDLRLVDKTGESWTVPPTRRFQAVGGEVNVFCLARRTEVKSFVYPNQSKYAKPVAGVRAEPLKEVVNG